VGGRMAGGRSEGDGGGLGAVLREGGRRAGGNSDEEVMTVVISQSFPNNKSFKFQDTPNLLGEYLQGIYLDLGRRHLLNIANLI
jgi:hypothetical protein